MTTREAQQRTLRDACRRASGEGVGFVGVVEADGSVTLRRDEEYATSHETTYPDLDAALARLAEDAAA